jgi:hypothetical protein
MAQPVAEWVKSLENVVDPIEALNLLIENAGFYGHDPYYADIKAGVFGTAERVAQAPITAYIVCVNDSMQAVILNDQKFAQEQVDVLAKAYFDTRKPTGFDGRSMSYTEFRHQYYWHLHEVPVLTTRRVPE